MAIPETTMAWLPLLTALPALLAIALVDHRTLTIPHLLTLWVALAGCAAAFASPDPGLAIAAAGCSAGGLLLLGGILGRRAGRPALGAADPPLLGAGALLAGPAGIGVVLAVTGIVGLIYAAMLGFRREIPMGPPMAIGIVAGTLHGLWPMATGP